MLKNPVLLKAIKKGSQRVWFWPFVIMGVILFSVLNYLVLVQTTTWSVFWESNIPFYNWSQIVLTLLLGFFISVGIALSFLYLEDRKESTGEGFGQLFVGSVLGAAATGCTVCGAFLLPWMGIAASLAVLPLGGLEIKTGALFISFLATREISKRVLGLCDLQKEGIVFFEKGYVGLDLTLQKLKNLWLWGVVFVFLLGVYSLKYLPPSWRVDFRRPLASSGTSQSLPQGSFSSSNINTQDLLAQINPTGGYEINAVYGDLGPRAIALGVIDPQKFRQVYERAGQPLTKEQWEILTKGSNKKIKIDKNNAYFLLNFFWAIGLANKNPILTEGQITKYGQGQIGYFASTGGWTLGKDRNAMRYYAKETLIPLTPEQQRLVEEVSGNVYRPCCGNPTSFPDCNHGMALLAVFELMASQGATKEEMYEAGKYFNAFWFPQSYLDLAMYFKITEGKDFKDIPGEVILSRDYSSVFGWQKARKTVQQRLGNYNVNLGGGGCGV